MKKRKQRAMSGDDLPRCCLCCNVGKCVRCDCKKKKKVCINCLPSRLGRCVNLEPVEDSLVAEDTPVVENTSPSRQPDDQ